MNDIPQLLLLTNAAATWFMCGVIWFVQVVHYPLFARYARDDFPQTALTHQQRTGWVVAPPMLIEFVTALGLLAVRPSLVPCWMPWAGVGLVAVWVTSTALVQVPAHGTLTAAFDPIVHRRLVASNWVRTVAWSARGVLCGGMLVVS